jgi:hypothetical protein
MSAIIGATGITFGDGTVQTTKTPAVVSAFTNDSGYILDSSISGTYTQIPQALYSWGWSGYALSITTYNVAGQAITSQSFNCNCNC